MNHQVNHRDVDHRFATVRQRLIVFAQSAVLAQPRKRAFDDPTLGQDHELARLAAFDDLNHTAMGVLGPIKELTAIPAVGPDDFQPREPTGDSSDHRHSPDSVLDVGGMDHDSQDQTERVNEDMSFSARNFLTRVIAAIPPLSAVLTDWLSRTAALGVGLRPAFERTFWRSLS